MTELGNPKSNVERVLKADGWGYMPLREASPGAGIWMVRERREMKEEEYETCMKLSDHMLVLAEDTIATYEMGTAAVLTLEAYNDTYCRNAIADSDTWCYYEPDMNGWVYVSQTSKKVLNVELLNTPCNER